MVFVCNHCHFLFSRYSEPERCPDCGKETVRPATDEEIREFEQQLKDTQEHPL